MFFNCPELLFLKGMTGALAPFSYLVLISSSSSFQLQAESRRRKTWFSAPPKISPTEIVSSADKKLDRLSLKCKN
jgi:hypothetical protein